MKWPVVAMCLCLLGCGYGEKRKKTEAPTPPSKELLEKYETYKALEKEATAKNDGWVSRDCDTLKFTGYRSLFGDVDLRRAELSPGEWTRRPKVWGECYPDHSKSRISRDGLLGVAWYAYNRRDRDLARRVVHYADRHLNIMGPGDVTRTDIRPALKATFIKLMGSGRIDGEAVPTPSGLEKGYERELQAMHILLLAEIHGGMAKAYLGWIREQVREEPRHPLYLLLAAMYTGGSYEAVERSLMDETYWPATHLPTSQNFCGGPWVMQRDQGGADWAPCPEKKPGVIWPGSDWLFVASFLI